MKKQLMKLGKRRGLVAAPLFIEGISRSGKFLLANLLSGFKNIEPVQYDDLLEHIPVFERYRFLDRKLAKYILQSKVDLDCHEALIGRSLNHRRADKSSIFNNPYQREFLKREHNQDIDKAIGDFLKQKSYSLFIVHELMPNIKIYFEVFPKMKVISLKRNPIDLVYSWYKREYGKRVGKDPKFFMVPWQKNHGSMPWYIDSIEKKYFSLNKVDQTILAMSHLLKMYKNSYKALPKHFKKNILLIKYEDILEKSNSALLKISKFLNRKKTKELARILKREKLPSSINLQKLRAKKLEYIKAKASPRYFKKLVALEKKYYRNSAS